MKALGDFSGKIRRVRPGTRVVAEGPFGTFTGAVRRRDKVVLIAGGIGITPVRALLEEMSGDVIVLYRVVRDDDIIFRDELEDLASARGIDLRFIIGDHETDEGRDLLSPKHLRQIVPTSPSARSTSAAARDDRYSRERASRARPDSLHPCRTSHLRKEHR